MPIPANKTDEAISIPVIYSIGYANCIYKLCHKKGGPKIKVNSSSVEAKSKRKVM